MNAKSSVHQIPNTEIMVQQSALLPTSSFNLLALHNRIWSTMSSLTDIKRQTIHYNQISLIQHAT